MAAAPALAGAAACSHKRSNDKPVYSVSYPIQKTLLHAIVGDNAEINTLIPVSTNPETYDPSMSTLVSLENSDAYFRLNTPGFEGGDNGQVRQWHPDRGLQPRNKNNKRHHVAQGVR